MTSARTRSADTPRHLSFQAARERRIYALHEAVIKRLVTAVKDTYSHQDLAEVYLDEAFGDELARPRVVLSEQFTEMWNDLLLDGEDDGTVENS